MSRYLCRHSPARRRSPLVDRSLAERGWLSDSGGSVGNLRGLEINATDLLYGFPLRLTVGMAIYHCHFYVGMARDFADRHDVDPGPDHPAQRGMLEAVG